MTSLTFDIPVHNTRRDRPDDQANGIRGSVALVTGGGRGIGQLVAAALAGEGAAVGIIARSRQELDRTVAVMRADGSPGINVASAVADVTDAAALAAAVGDVQHQLGPVDILVNNAGITGPIGPMWELDPEAWWHTMDVNVRGLLLATNLVLPNMVARGRGRILNLTSEAGTHRWPLVSAYSVSKAAVVKLTENLAHETSRHGITVLSVHPGLLPIGMANSVTDGSARTPAERHIQAWTRAALAEGRGATVQQAIDLITRLARGDGDLLSGRHISVHDDLDAMIERIDEVIADDLYVLHPTRLGQPDKDRASKRALAASQHPRPPFIACAEAQAGPHGRRRTVGPSIGRTERHLDYQP